MKRITERATQPVSETRRYWRVMTFYERFEHVVALILTAAITLIIVVALWRLLEAVVLHLLPAAANPLDHAVFQGVFGMIMTLLIAMEFKHSILEVLERRAHIIQVETVVLIALLALARKFIILDTATMEAAKLLGLAAIALVLGVVYWLLRDRDDRAIALRRRPRGTTGDAGTTGD